MSKIVDGRFNDPKVEIKIFPTIERGALPKISAIVVHQTGAASAKSTFESYSGHAHGAHFLIDKDGKIYQTARVNRKTHHVGRIKSRCLETHVCTAEEKKEAKEILFSKGKSYSTRTNELSKFELKKSYPARYPSNDDSIGIELVGETVGGGYVAPTSQQTSSVKYLIGGLEKELALNQNDVYRHPEVSYKQPSEAKGVQWR